MNHKHHHCPHPTLKYCPHCNVVYCVDCGHEWCETQYTIATWPKVTWYYANDCLNAGVVPASDEIQITCTHHAE